MAHTTAGQFWSGLMIITIMSLIFGMPTLAHAAPIRQGANAEASCETVSVGQYYCKIDGKCYYCDTKTNPDPNKNCRSTTCDAAMVNPGMKGAVRPFGGKAPIMRRGVEAESSATEGAKEPPAPTTTK